MTAEREDPGVDPIPRGAEIVVPVPAARTQNAPVLHGTFLPRRDGVPGSAFFFWAEQEALRRRGRGRPRKEHAGLPPPHPFAVQACDLCAWLAPAAATPTMVTLDLPSGKSGPLPSPGMAVPGIRPSPGTPGLRPWSVEGVLFDLPEAIPCLLELPRAPCRPGTDLGYWRDASLFLLELLARHHFFPGIAASPDQDRIAFRWRPSLREQGVRQKFARLARAMPPVSRMAGQAAPEALLRAFLDEGVAALAARFTPPLPGLGETCSLLLRHPEGVRLPKGTADRLVEQSGAWAGHLEENGQSGFRTAFRLEEPDGDGPWHLSFLLQSEEDESLVVPASLVWENHPDLIPFLKTGLPRAEELYLRDLGRAGRVVPAVAQGLAAMHPAGVTLKAAEAYRFLAEQAPVLAASGFAVYVPSWWRERDRALSLRLHIAGNAGPALSSGHLAMDSLVDYDWRIAIGGEDVGDEEFLALSRLKEPLTRFRGRWVMLGPGVLARVEKFLARSRSGKMTLREAMRAATGLGDTAAPLPVDGVTAPPGFEPFLSRLCGARPPEGVPPPPGFYGTLRPYQERGYGWLRFMRDLGLGACLADDMGLGKTVQVLALLDHERESGGGPSLVVCPTSVIGNWAREAARFTPGISVMVHHGSSRLAGEEFCREAGSHDLVLTSYALLHRDRGSLSQVAWNGVILDEAQNIRNPQTRQARAAKSVAARFRVALSGTPVENRPGDLWSIMDFLNPGYLGSQEQFRAAFEVPIVRARDRAAGERLRRVMRPFLLRREKTDPAIAPDLPDRIETPEYCTLTREQASLYEVVVRELLGEIEGAEGIRRRGLVLAALTRLKQVCDHPALYLGDVSSDLSRSGKLARLAELVEEVLASGESALVFTQFVGMGEILCRALAEISGEEVLFLHGGVPRAAREELVRRFSQDGGPRLFVLSLRAGGTGLNLTRATHVFHVDRWYNPAVERQATDRAHRIGQTRTVQVHTFICQGTLEERIDEMLREKAAIAGSLVGSGEDWLTGLSIEELRSVFSLRKALIAGEDDA